MPRFLLFLVISSAPSCPKKETKDSQFSENQILCRTVHCIATGWATVDALLANKSLPRYKELEINSVKMLPMFSQWYSNQNPTFLPQKNRFFFYKYISIQTILSLCQEKKKTEVTFKQIFAGCIKIQADTRAGRSTGGFLGGCRHTNTISPTDQ